MNKLGLAIIFGLALLCSCGKNNSALPPAARHIDASSNNAPLPGTVDAPMTALLKKFVTDKGRLPGSFLEFAGAEMDTFPRAPQGFAYQIDPTTTEVKLVRQ
jgi:hypothetical protein